MFFCGKKIVYLHCYEEKEKGEAAGFARFSEEKGRYKVQICIRKVTQWEDGSYQVLFEGIHKAVVLGEIRIKRGEGVFECLLPFKEGRFCFDKEEEAQDNPVDIAVCGRQEKSIRGHLKATNCENILEKKTEEQAEEKADKQAEYKGKIPEIAKAEKDVSEMRQEWVEDYAGDKWKQLQKVYPKVHPFGDDREYISIEPKDFIVLQSSYQKLVNNSFLLHGFYNYRHIILGSGSGLGTETGYYLGVPGTFYEREKMVAVMFGFEGFECSGPVEIGKFGYYMRRVEL